MDIETEVKTKKVKPREWYIKQAELMRKARKEKSLRGELKERKTIIREQAEAEARAIFVKKALKNIKILTDIEIKQAKKPDNTSNRHYILDQLIGKPAELTKLNLNKGNIKGLEEDMRQWAKKPIPELEMAIKKLPEVKEDIN